MAEFYRYHLLGLIPVGPVGQWTGQSLRRPWRYLGWMKQAGASSHE